MRILLVDDEKKFINMLAKRLELRGFHPMVALNGEDAIALAKETSFQIAILDIKMPGISGLKLKNELAKINKALKFIFVTGHGAIDQNECQGITEDTCLSKPLNIEILIEHIKKMK